MHLRDSLFFRIHLKKELYISNKKERLVDANRGSDTTERKGTLGKAASNGKEEL